MNKDWNRNYKNFLNGVSAQELGRRSRSAQRHDIDKFKAIELYKRGLNDLNIASALGVSKGDVYRWRKLNGLISNMTPQPEDSTPFPKKRK